MGALMTDPPPGVAITADDGSGLGDDVSPTFAADRAAWLHKLPAASIAALFQYRRDARSAHPGAANPMYLEWGDAPPLIAAMPRAFVVSLDRS